MTSPCKSRSSISVVAESPDKMISKSDGSHYQKAASSKPSASLIYRKQNAYNQGAFRSSFIPASSDIRQRVLSARRLKIKSYQNQLAEAKQTIEDLLHENRLLQTLHKRQDSALAKYESSNAELPQLLSAHSEELRIWQTKCKNMQLTNKDLENKIKQKESIILSLTDQNKYYSQLNKDKNLLERQQLRQENEILSNELKEKDIQINNLRKKTELEIKNLKLQLQNEQKKTRSALSENEKYRIELLAFNKLDQLNNPNNTKHPKCNLKEPIKNDIQKTIEQSADSKRLDLIKKEKKIRTAKISCAASYTDHGDGDASASNFVKRSDVTKLEPNAQKQNGQNYKNFDTRKFDKQSAVANLNPGFGDNLEHIENIVSFRSKFSETDFNTKRMRNDITSIRSKLLGEDYERREEFIDGFCLQQSINGTDEDDEEKYRSYTKDNLKV